MTENIFPVLMYTLLEWELEPVTILDGFLLVEKVSGEWQISLILKSKADGNLKTVSEFTPKIPGFLEPPAQGVKITLIYTDAGIVAILSHLKQLFKAGFSKAQLEPIFRAGTHSLPERLTFGFNPLIH